MPHHALSPQKILGPFALAMIAIVAIIDLRGLPMMASYGFSAIVVYGLAALLFLIPSGLVCAELSTQVEETGGMYVWVRNAFGNRLGFLAIWLEWLNNVIGFPASLSFIAATLAYLFDPQLAQNKMYILGATLSILWATTLFTLGGIKASSRLSMLGGLFGTIIPALLITVLGFSWYFLGKPMQMTVDWQHFIPSHDKINPGFFAAIILGFGGMQIVAFHTSNVIRPKHTFPRAIAIAIVVIVSIALLTSLAVASVVPPSELSLLSGITEGFGRFFSAFNMPWATPLLVCLIVFSLLATLNAWFFGPARGLVVAAHNGFLPKLLARQTKKEVPAPILILQAIVATVLSAIFLYMPDISSAFWILLNLSSQSALLVYIFIFAAAIKLRYKKSERVVDGYAIPGGNKTMWCVAGTGIVTCLVALVTSIIPPTLVKTGGIWHYEFILLGSNMVFLGIPLVIIYFYTRRHQKASHSPIKEQII